MSACDSKYVGKNCMCLPDPIFPEKTMCGYLDRDSGFLYACSTGCCSGGCPDQNFNVKMNVEYGRSEGISLPEGFGKNMIYGTSDWMPVGAATFTPPQGGSKDVFTQLLILAGLLLLILVAAFLT